MSRSPDDVQAEIERARHQLATTLDQIVERTDPHRLVDQGRSRVLAAVNTPAGKAVIGVVGGLVGGLVVFRVVQRVRHRGR